MKPSLQRLTPVIAALFLAGSAGAQQAATASAEAGAPPTWEVLMRGRTHVPTPATTAITAADLKTRLYIFADDSMQGRLLATAGNAKDVEYIAAELKRGQAHVRQWPVVLGEFDSHSLNWQRRGIVNAGCRLPDPRIPRS